MCCKRMSFQSRWYSDQRPGESMQTSSIPSDPQRRKPDDQTCCDGVVEPSTCDGWPPRRCVIRQVCLAPSVFCRVPIYFALVWTSRCSAPARGQSQPLKRPEEPSRRISSIPHRSQQWQMWRNTFDADWWSRAANFLRKTPSSITRTPAIVATSPLCRRSWTRVSSSARSTGTGCRRRFPAVGCTGHWQTGKTLSRFGSVWSPVGSSVWPTSVSWSPRTRTLSSTSAAKSCSGDVAHFYVVC